MSACQLSWLWQLTSVFVRSYINGGSGMSFSGECAACPLSLAKFPDSGNKVRNLEVRPTFLQKDKLCEGAFPEKKVRQALLSASPDEQINFGRAAAKDLCQNVGKR